MDAFLFEYYVNVSKDMGGRKDTCVEHNTINNSSTLLL